MGKIPDFDNQGLIPPGDYEVTFDELRDSILVHGPSSNGAAKGIVKIVS